MRYNPKGMLNPNDIYTGDCIKLLNDSPEAWVDLVFADPPFNIGYGYDQYDDRRHSRDYLTWAEKWLGEAVRAEEAFEDGGRNQRERNYSPGVLEVRGNELLQVDGVAGDLE